MNSKLNRYSNGHAWRVFTTDFDLVPHNVNYEDYVKFCDLINQIFRNLFNIDYNISEHVSHDQFKCSKSIFDTSTDTVSNKPKKSKINFLLNMPSYSIDFSFMFIEVEKNYVFETCDFSVKYECLLANLPMGNKNQICALCSCHFTEYQTYNFAYVSYNQIIAHTGIFFDGYPMIHFTYMIKETNVNIELEYLYEDSNQWYSREPEKYFSFKETNINLDTLLKLQQLHTLIHLYLSSVDLTNYFPYFNKKIFESAQSTKSVLIDFLEDVEDFTDIILLLEMVEI